MSMKKRIQIIKQNFFKSNFGFSIEYFESLKEIFQKAKPNEKSNNFPDYTFSSGFIEHFMITSSKENGKGSPHKIAIVNFEKQNEKIAKKLSRDNPSYNNC